MPPADSTSLDQARFARILRHYPELETILRILRDFSERGAFPINSCVELELLLGGDQATVSLGAQAISVGYLRHVIPAYYFPIASEDDLIAKIADLQVRRPSPPAGRDARGTFGENFPRVEQYGGLVAKLPKGASRPPRLSRKHLHKLAVENVDRDERVPIK